MFNVGPAEMVVILVVALLVVGPDKLPGVAKQIGKAMGEVRRLGTSFQAEMRDAMQEPVHREPPPPADEPRPRRPRPLEAAPADLHDDDPQH